MSEAGQRTRVATVHGGISIALAILLAVLIIYPLIQMFIRFLGPGSAETILGTLSSSSFPTMITDTLGVVGASGLFAIVVGTILAWANERTDAGIGALSRILPLVPFLMPNVTMAIGWVFLASPSIGFLNGYVGDPLRTIGIDIRFDIYTWGGLVFLYTLYFLPYAYLTVAAALRNLDSSLEEASTMCRAGLWRTLWHVTLPTIRPSLLSAALLVPIVLLALYGIPAIIAVPQDIDILAVRVIRTLTRQFPPNVEEALALSLVMLVVVGTFWLLQRRLSRSNLAAQIGGRGARASRIRLRGWKWPVRLFVFAYVFIAAILPVMALVVVALQPYWSRAIDVTVWSFNNFQSVFASRLTSQSILNSFLLGSIGGALVILIAAVLAEFIRRNGARTGRVVDGLLKGPSVIPHIVTGVGVLLAFSGPPFNLSGTIVILFVAYLIVFMPQASISATSALSQVGNDLVEASSMSRASEGRTFRQVLLPLALPGLASGWAILFVLMAGNLSVAALLSGARNPVMGFTILDAWEQGSFSRLAALSVVVTLMSAAVVFVMLGVSRRRHWARS